MTTPFETGPVIDTGRLNELREDVGPEIVTQLIDMFLDGAPDRLAGLRDLPRQSEATASAEMLHSLKSSAATLGATRLSELAEQAERQLRAGNHAGAVELAGPIEDALGETVARLREYRQQSG